MSTKQMYCVKCKGRTGTGPVTIKIAPKTKQPMATGRCTSCGTKKCRFVSRRGGKGFSDWIRKAYHHGKSVYDNPTVQGLIKSHGPQALAWAKKKASGGRLRRRRRRGGAMQIYRPPSRNMKAGGVLPPGSRPRYGYGTRCGGGIRLAVQEQPANPFLST